jgi:hypothetical protein
VQKILRDGHTVTILTVGTGGLFDQRIVGGNDVPRPAQWHRVTIHNEGLGNYAVRQLVKEYVSCISPSNCFIDMFQILEFYFSYKRPDKLPKAWRHYHSDC